MVLRRRILGCGSRGIYDSRNVTIMVSFRSAIRSKGFKFKLVVVVVTLVPHTKQKTVCARSIIGCSSNGKRDTFVVIVWKVSHIKRRNTLIVAVRLKVFVQFDLSGVSRNEEVVKLANGVPRNLEGIGDCSCQVLRMHKSVVGKIQKLGAVASRSVFKGKHTHSIASSVDTRRHGTKLHVTHSNTSMRKVAKNGGLVHREGKLVDDKHTLPSQSCHRCVPNDDKVTSFLHDGRTICKLIFDEGIDRLVDPLIHQTVGNRFNLRRHERVAINDLVE